MSRCLADILKRAAAVVAVEAAAASGNVLLLGKCRINDNGTLFKN